MTSEVLSSPETLRELGSLPGWLCWEWSRGCAHPCGLVTWTWALQSRLLCACTEVGARPARYQPVKTSPRRTSPDSPASWGGRMNREFFVYATILNKWTTILFWSVNMWIIGRNADFYQFLPKWIIIEGYFSAFYNSLSAMWLVLLNETFESSRASWSCFIPNKAKTTTKTKSFFENHS